MSKRRTQNLGLFLCMLILAAIYRLADGSAREIAAWGTIALVCLWLITALEARFLRTSKDRGDG